MTGCFVTLQEGDNSASGGLLSPLNTTHLITYNLTVKQRNSLIKEATFNIVGTTT